jgi:hypothetical protein
VSLLFAHGLAVDAIRAGIDIEACCCAESRAWRAGPSTGAPRRPRDPMNSAGGVPVTLRSAYTRRPASSSSMLPRRPHRHRHAR